MDLLIPEVILVQKIVRSVAVYAFLLVVFRVMGKRQLGQMTAFDLIVLLIISELVQNAMVGDDNSLTGGLLSVTQSGTADAPGASRCGTRSSSFSP